MRLALGGGRCLFRFLCGFGGGGLLRRADGGLCRLLCLYGPGGGIDGGLCGGLIGGAGFGLKPREALRLGFRRVRHGLCRLAFEGEGFFLRLAEMLVRGGQHFFRRLLEVGRQVAECDGGQPFGHRRQGQFDDADGGLEGDTQACRAVAYRAQADKANSTPLVSSVLRFILAAAAATPLNTCWVCSVVKPMFLVAEASWA